MMLVARATGADGGGAALLSSRALSGTLLPLVSLEEAMTTGGLRSWSQCSVRARVVVAASCPT